LNAIAYDATFPVPVITNARGVRREQLPHIRSVLELAEVQPAWVLWPHISPQGGAGLMNAPPSNGGQGFEACRSRLGRCKSYCTIGAGADASFEELSNLPLHRGADPGDDVNDGTWSTPRSRHGCAMLERFLSLADELLSRVSPTTVRSDVDARV